jgi:hypothetical protein
MKRKFIWWLGFITLFVLFSVTAYGQWPTAQGNFQRTGTSVGTSIDPNTLTLEWFFQPGVGNPLNPGFPNGSGSPIFNGGQGVVAGFGKVFFVYNDALDQDVLVALDAATGAYSWHFIIRLPGLGAGAIQVPTVALRDTGGPALDTVVYVYGSNNSVHARKASDGTLIWSRTGINGAAASLLSGAPIVYDTLLIIADNGGAGAARRHVSALNTRDGSTVWTSVQVPFRMFCGPSISNDTLYVSGRGTGISGDGGGAIYALDANTGATLATYDPALPYNWQHGPAVFGDYIVSVSRNDALGAFAGSIHRLSHDLSSILAFPGPPGTSIGFTRFYNPELYIEPSVGETTMIYGTTGLSADVPPGVIVMRRFAPAPGGVLSLRSYQLLVGQIHGPGAVASGNGILFQGDDAGYWWVMDANSYGGGFFGGLYPFWLKQFTSFITAGAAISVEDDTLVAIMDGNANVAGWRNGVVTTRPRAQVYFDYNDPFFSGGNLGLATTEISLGIVPTDTIAGTGGFTNVQVKAFQNAGNDVLTYSLSHGSSPVALTAADFGAPINLSRTKPTRNKMAREMVDQMTVTSGNAFLEKKFFMGSASIKDPLDVVEDGITSLKELRDLNTKATYFGTTKLQEAKKTLANPGWLFVNDETGGTVAPGDSVYLDIVAVNPNVGYGEFFGEIALHSTNEPDVQGIPLDTTRLAVRLLVGWLPEAGELHAAPGLDVILSKTNYGRDVFAGIDGAHGFEWHGEVVGFDAWIVVGNSETTFAGVEGGYSPHAADQAVSNYGPEDVFNLTTLNALAYDGPFTDAVDYDFHETKYAHKLLPLKIKQYAWSIQSDLAGATYEGDAVYQTVVIINTSEDSVLGIEVGTTTDSDVLPSATNNQGAPDAQHDNITQWEASVPNLVYGILRLPRDNVNSAGSDVLRSTITRGVPGATEYYGNGAQKSDTLQAWWNNQEKSILGPTNDVWQCNGSKRFDLGPGESHTITFVWYGADVSGGASLVDRLKEWALLAGYYRGDVNGVHQNGASPGITLSDVVYLSNYVQYGGAAPIPFTSQGDVNGDDAIDIADVSYLYDYVASNGATAAPIDRDRFIPDPWNNRATGRPSLNDDTNWTP